MCPARGSHRPRRRSDRRHSGAGDSPGSYRRPAPRAPGGRPAGPPATRRTRRSGSAGNRSCGRSRCARSGRATPAAADRPAVRPRARPTPFRTCIASVPRAALRSSAGQLGVDHRRRHPRSAAGSWCPCGHRPSRTAPPGGAGRPACRRRPPVASTVNSDSSSARPRRSAARRAPCQHGLPQVVIVEGAQQRIQRPLLAWEGVDLGLPTLLEAPVLRQPDAVEVLRIQRRTPPSRSRRPPG